MTRHALKLDQLGGSSRALLDALTAWMGQETGSQAGQVSSLRLFRESSPDPLKETWPEFVAFVEGAEASRLRP